MSLVKDFKKFAMRGNVLDMAIGFTVGAAFTTVVKSLVSDIIMPPIGLLTGNADFSERYIVLRGDLPEGGFQSLQEAQEAGAVTLNYGQFINSCISLLLVAIAMFVIIRLANRVDEELDQVFGEEPPPPGEPEDKKCEFCRTTIPYRATRCPHCTSQLTVAEAGS